MVRSCVSSDIPPTSWGARYWSASASARIHRPPQTPSCFRMCRWSSSHRRQAGNNNMRDLFLMCLLSASAFAQSESLGAFTNSGDVGDPARKGTTAFDASKGQYRITGSGANIWAKQYQFPYVWREMPGNFSVTSTMEFRGKG